MTPWKFPLPGRKTGKGSLYESAINSKIFSVLTFLVSILFGFYLFVPTTAIKNRLVYEIERQVPVKIKLAELHLLPLLTFMGEGIEVASPSLPGYILKLDSFSVDPWWSSLIRGTPGVNGSLDGLGGNLEFSANNQGDVLAFAENLHVVLPLATGLSLELVGDVATALFEGSLLLHSAEERRVEVELSQLQVKGLDLLAGDSGDISLGQVRLAAVGEQGIIKVVQFETLGGDIEVVGSGDLLLAGNLPRSRINLNLVVKPGPGASPELRDLLALAGPRQTDGSYRLRLSGTLGKPVVN